MLDPIEIRMTGNPNGRYFKLGPIHARRLGLRPHPNRPHALVLAEEAWDGSGIDVSGNSRLVLPTGAVLTAVDLTTLAHKSGDPDRGWEIYVDDPGGYPSWDLPEPDVSS